MTPEQNKWVPSFQTGGFWGEGGELVFSRQNFSVALEQIVGLQGGDVTVVKFIFSLSEVSMPGISNIKLVREVQTEVERWLRS